MTSTADGMAGHLAGPIADKNTKVERVKRLTELAEGGDVKAMYELGRCYFCGDGVARSPETVALWYKRAADLGHTLAQREVAVIYMNGNGVECDDGEALRYFKLAADGGDIIALQQLGNIYLCGVKAERDTARAAKCFAAAIDAAAERPNLSQRVAALKLGDMYFCGIGVEKSPAEAFGCYSIAVRGINPEAYYRLGMCYAHGTGTEKDLNAAKEWLEKAARHGIVEAHAALRELFEPVG